jgi:hypothetical protein
VDLTFTKSGAEVNLPNFPKTAKVLKEQIMILMALKRIVQSYSFVWAAFPRL